MTRWLPALTLVGAALWLLAATGDAVSAQEDDGPDPLAVLTTTLAEAGVRLDLESGACAIPGEVLVRTELLEYLLVGRGGSAHESLFSTDVQPSLLNTAILAMGLEPGSNAIWFEKDPAPTREEIAAGTPRYDVHLPDGDALYLYALWKEDGEVYFFRVEDLVRNLATGRSMKRHAWVYLGSRFAIFAEDEPEVFVADKEENVVNISYFRAGNTLLTSALEESLEQTIWVGNSWLLPESGWPVQLLFSREPLDVPPAAWVETLVEPKPGSLDGADGGRGGR